jgi:hypothetical protein
MTGVIFTLMVKRHGSPEIPNIGEAPNQVTVSISGPLSEPGVSTILPPNDAGGATISDLVTLTVEAAKGKLQKPGQYQSLGRALQAAHASTASPRTRP